MAFATIVDLENRWRILNDEEQVRAAELLEDAAAFLTTLLDSADILINEHDKIQARNLKSVSCSIVHRIMGTEDSLFGVTQFSQTAGVFTESGTAANPNGDMYLTAQEKALLGIPATGKRAGLHFLRGAIHNPDGSEIDDW